jgi:hypothetical protein
MITNYTDGLSSIGNFQKDIASLPNLNDFRYENFFKIYLTENDQYYYNLLSFTVFMSNDLNTDTYYEIDVNKLLPWTTISYNEYRTMDLWWLIMIINNIYNPLKFPEPGTKLKIIHPQYVRTILTRLNDSI